MAQAMGATASLVGPGRGLPRPPAGGRPGVAESLFGETHTKLFAVLSPCFPDCEIGTVLIPTKWVTLGLAAAANSGQRRLLLACSH